MSPQIGRPEITLVVRAGCHLCAQAREVVSRVAADTGAALVEVDVDTDPGLSADQRAGWSEQVPVVLVDGAQHDFWRVDERRLRAALDPGRRRPWQRRRPAG